MSLPYNAGVPQGTQTIAETQDPILKNFSSIDKAFNGPTGGATPFTTYNLQNATSSTAASSFTPAPGVGKGALYTTTTSANNTELAYINAANATALAPGFQGVRMTGGGITAAAWVYFDSVGTIQAQYNVGSVAVTAPGANVYTVNFTRAFSSANYAAITSFDISGVGGGTNVCSLDVQATNAGSYVYRVRNAAGGFIRPTRTCIVFFGFLV